MSESDDERPLLVTPALIGACLAVFAALSAGGVPSAEDTSRFIEWGANFGLLTPAGEWWRLLTSLFLHFSLLHIGVNMLALWDSGRVAERFYGRAGFLALYLAAGLTASLASLVFNPTPVVSGGASGAIYGAYGAVAAWVARHREQYTRRTKLLFALSMVAFLVVSLALSLWHGGVDHAAHGGGFVAGCLLGWLCAGQDGPRRPLVALAGGALLAGPLLVLVPSPAYDWRQDQAARHEVENYLAAEQGFMAVWNEQVAERKADAFNDEELARRLREGPLAAWEEGVQRLDAYKLPRSSPSFKLHALVTRYAALRVEAGRAMVEALEQQDPRKAARFLIIQGELVEVVKELETLHGTAALAAKARAGAEAAAPPR